MTRLRKWLHDWMGWGYPSTLLDFDPFQSVYACQFCDGRLAEDSMGDWFHLPKPASVAAAQPADPDVLKGQRVGAPHIGCICPPTSEQTCGNPLCPRKAPNFQGHAGIL